MARLDVRPEAELDAQEAGAWYDGERGGLGAELLTELRTTFVRIEGAPFQFPLVSGEVRRAILAGHGLPARTSCWAATAGRCAASQE